MDGTRRPRRFVESLLSFGAYPEESNKQRARRRIILIATWVTAPVTLLTVLLDLTAGFTWVAAGNVITVVGALGGVAALQWRPHHFAVIVNGVFVLVFVPQLIETTLFGGLVSSAFVVLYGIVLVLGALVALSIRAAFGWFLAFIASVVFGAVIPEFVDRVYEPRDVLPKTVFNVIAVASLTFIVMTYFVRQRDRAQQQSDDLLHNILPDEIAARLKNTSEMIAESFDSASVLFADVVGFTPMSADMSPPALVGLLNRLFSDLDGYVNDLGLEKIKTVGDEYMVASGVPEPRRDHALAMAELALRMRAHIERTSYYGHRLEMRIGINSGPVVAGIIGTHKFSYDLWGDTVNLASRMESTGVPGSIQVTPTTYDLIKSAFVCEPRGPVKIKGKGEINTYLLLSAKPQHRPTGSSESHGSPRP